MVIQRSWKNSNPDVLLQNSSSEDSSGSWQLSHSNRGVSISQTSNSMPNRHVINRQVALNTLAAMHRRYNIPGMVQTGGRPPAEFRASANKSLDILRQNIQSAVTKEIDQVIKKYLEKFFVPAVNNIRSNLGEESVGEDQVRAVCRAMLDGARCLYSAQPRPSAPPARAAASPSELSDSESSNGADSRFGRPSSSPSYGKRKESDTDSDVGTGGRRKRRTEGVLCPAHKWDPARLNQDTLFIMGSIANKVLGLGQSRGRLYSKHAGLLRYPADSADKEWIANQNMTTPAGGRTYIMVLEDIEELVCSEDYRHSPSLRLNDLSGFRAPPFMLRKIQAYLSRRGEMSEDYTSSMPTPTPPPIDAPISKSQIKLEDPEDSSDTVNVKTEHMDEHISRDQFKNITAEEVLEHATYSYMHNQPVKMENSSDRSIKYDNNGNSQQLIQPCGNFTSIVSSGISSMDNNYWKCVSSNQQLGNVAEKVELNGATEFIDADIEFLSSDFCTYVDSEADVKKSFDRISDGGGGDLFMSGDSNILSTPNSPGLNTNTLNYNQPSQDSMVSRPGIVTSFMGTIAVGPMSSNVVHTYVSSSTPNTVAKSPTLTSSHIASPPPSFSVPSNPVTFAQALNTFSHNPPNSHAQVVSQNSSPNSYSTNTITLQPNLMQPTTRTVYSLASTTKSITPGSTIIGFGTRPAIGGNIINASNFINIATKNFSSGNILHNAIVSRNMINRGMSIRSELSKPPQLTNTPTVSKSMAVVPNVSGTIYSKPSSLSSKIDDDASITTTKAMIDNTCNSSAMLKKVLTLGSAGVNKTFLTPPTQKMNVSRSSSSSSSNLSASHATLTALLSSGSDSTHSDKKTSFVIPTTEK